MLILYSNIIKHIFVKIGDNKLTKITFCGLVIASFLAVSILSRAVAAPVYSATLWETGRLNTYDAGVAGYSPVYTADGMQVYEHELIEFVIAATDPDGDTLVYSASDLPDGATFDAETATFSWTPRYDQAGVYIIHFEVTDGEFTDSEDIIITVVQLYEDWDVNGDSYTNVLDMILIGQHWGETGLTGWIREDANEDGTINVLDMITIGQHWTGTEEWDEV